MTMWLRPRSATTWPFLSIINKAKKIKDLTHLLFMLLNEFPNLFGVFKNFYGEGLRRPDQNRDLRSVFSFHILCFLMDFMI